MDIMFLLCVQKEKKTNKNIHYKIKHAIWLQFIYTSAQAFCMIVWIGHYMLCKSMSKSGLSS